MKGWKGFQAEAVARTRVWRAERAVVFWEGMGEVWAEGYLLRGTEACKVVRSLSGKGCVRTDLPHPSGSGETLKGHRLVTVTSSRTQRERLNRQRRVGQRVGCSPPCFSVPLPLLK